MSPNQAGLASAAVRAIRWNYFGNVFSIGCSLVVTTVLARILGPGPFGEAMIASTVYGFVNLFVNGGFGQALVQKKELSALEIRRTFTTQLLLSLLFTTIVVLLAPFIARQFRSAAATPVIRVMGLVIVLQALGLVSSSLLRRDMRFHIIQHANISAYVVGYIFIGLPLALHGCGVWSLVAAYLSQAFVNSGYLYAAVRHSLKLSFHGPGRDIMRFGSAVVGTNLVNWGHSNLDNVAASRLGPSSLGLYGRVCNLAYQPVTATVTILQPVLLSSSAKLHTRPEVVGNLFLACLALTSGVLLPAYLSLALIPDTVMLGLYGARWVAAVPLLVPMALAMPLWGAMGLCGPVLAGLGRPQLELWSQAVTCIVAAVGFFIGAQFSLPMVAWVLFLVSATRFVTMAAFACRALQIRPWTLARVMAGRVFVAMPFGALVLGVDRTLRAYGCDVTVCLAMDVIVSVSLMIILIRSLPNIVFGGHAVCFLQTYAIHLPAWCQRWLASFPNTILE